MRRLTARSSLKSCHVLKKITLEAIATLGLFPDDVKHGVDEFRAIGVMALGPVVTGSSLAKHKIIGPEDLTIRSRSDTVHGSGLQIHEHRTRHVSTTTGFVVVHIYSLQLQIWVSMVRSCRVDTMFIANHLQLMMRIPVSLLHTFYKQNSQDWSTDLERALMGPSTWLNGSMSYSFNLDIHSRNCSLALALILTPGSIQEAASIVCNIVILNKFRTWLPM